MSRKLLSSAAVCMLAAMSLADMQPDAGFATVPDWNEAQEKFFAMSPSERRERFTNEVWRKSVRLESRRPWRRAREGEMRRFVNLGGVPNMRDFGGMKTQDGKVFKKGLLYRSAGLNLNAPYRVVTNDAGKVRREYYGRGGERLLPGAREYAVKTLGIRTDLDLRGPGECSGMRESPLGPEVKWIRTTFRDYGGLFGDDGKKSFKETFAVLLDEKNYPLVFHCIAGADRTGTLAYVVEALCGVPDEDLVFDWELTALANPSVGFAHEKRYDKLVAGFLKYPGSTTGERVAAFVKSLGFTDADIARLREILLEEPEDDGSASSAAENETAKWQAEIDRASASGGGVVSVPAGVHRVGGLELRSNVELRLEKGAVLEALYGLENYRVVKLPYSEGDWSAIVMGLNVTNAAVTGDGTIDGRGAQGVWHQDRP